MAVRIQLRRDTSANWISNNPTLREGELGIETDTLKIKVGTGAAWNSTPNYANVVPSDLNTTLGDYVTVSDIGAQSGVVGLNASYNAIIPGSSIIIEGSTADANETTLTVTDPTADRTITFPDATGTVALAENVAALSGATFTGNINVPTAITFEGATADSYETTIQVTDPTADRTITFPDAAGTVALTSNIPSTTDTLSEGTTNLYFTDERAQDAAYTALSNGTHTNISVSYNDSSNAISLTGAVTYTDENAQDAVGNAVGTGLSYNDSTGAISVNTTTIQARVADVSDTEIGYLNGVTSAIQTQIDGKISASSTDTLTNKTLTLPKVNENVELTASSTELNILDGATLSTAELNYVDGVTSAIQTQIDGKLSLSGGTMTGLLTLSGSPENSNHAATKAYVDNISAGLNFHAAVHAATTADLSATYDNGAKTLTGTGAFPQIDSHTVNETERVLVKSQSDAKQNGIYTLTDDGDPSGSWVLTRAADADNTPSGEIAYGDFTFVQNGSTNGGYGYIMTTTGTITLGTSNINYTQFNTGQAVVAGNGLSEVTPGTLSINTGITADLSTAQTLTNKTLTSPKINEDVALSATATELNVLDGITASTAELNILDGVTASYTEINTLDGITASTAELNILDGATLSTTELNYVDGVTSSIQTQLNAKQAVVSGVSDTEIGYLDGVTSAIQTQIDTKVSKNGGTGSIITNSTASDIGFIVKGASSQSADYFQIQGSSGTVLANFNASNQFNVNYGSIYAPYGLRAGSNNHIGLASISAFATNAAYLALGVKGYSGQTASLQEWQNSSGTVLTKVDASGNITAPSLTLSTTALAITSGGTGLSSYASGDILYASATNTLAKLAKGTDGQILTLASGVPSWAAAPITLPTQTDNAGKYLTTDGSTASWASLVVPIVTGTATVDQNTAVTVDTTALSAFTSIEYMVSLKQGSKVRTSKVMVQTDGTSVDMTEFAITETGGTIAGVVVSAAVSSTNAVLQVTATDGASTNVAVKFSKVAL